MVTAAFFCNIIHSRNDLLWNGKRGDVRGYFR